MNSEITQVPDSKGKKSRWKLIVSLGIIVGIIGAACVVVLLVLPDIFVNKYLKETVEKEFASAYPDYTLMIADLDINLFNSKIELGDVLIQSKDSSFWCSIGSPSAKGVGWWQLIWKGTAAQGALSNTIAEAHSISFKLKKAQYEIHCAQIRVSLLDSIIVADSLEIYPMVDDSLFFEESEFRKTRLRMVLPQLKIHGFSHVEKLQGKMYSASSVQIRDISMNMLVDAYKPEKPDTAKKFSIKKLLLSLKEKIRIDSFNIENARVQYGESLALGAEPTEGYKINCGGLYASVHDSNLIVNDLAVDPLMDENQYFDASKFGRTRITLQLPKLKLCGLSFPDILEGDKYQARLIQMHGASVGIQVSKFKSKNTVITKLPMPNEMLATVKQIIQIDSISVREGHIAYGEYYTPRSKPALIVFNNLNGEIIGVTNNNNNGDTATIHFSSEFMDGATMDVTVRTPLTSPTFSLQSHGTLSPMKLIKLNTFLETAERVRIKSGVALSSSFNLTVHNGKAKGTVSIEYKDFSLAFIDQKSRSDKGIFNVIKSFLANTFKFNDENLRDKSGKLKKGNIKYTRKPDDTFMQVLWYSVRSGVAGIIGFPQN